MFHDLDKTLETLLTNELSEAFTPSQISFTTPDTESVGTKPALNLFLYDVRENLELRSSVDSLKRQSNGTAIRVRPPVRVDCSYLITYWTKETSTNDSVRDEHRFLGMVMKALVRYRKLPSELLQGELQGQEPSVRAVSLQTGHLNSMGEFWQALGGKPKVAINYTVTISVSVDKDQEIVPLVTESRYQ